VSKPTIEAGHLFFWPPNINLRANFGVSRPMSIDKVNCFSRRCAGSASGILSAAEPGHK
jgi:hypothetical protein